MEKIFIVLWGLSTLMAVLSAVRWGDLDSPGKILDHFDKDSLMRAREYTILFTILLIEICFIFYAIQKNEQCLVNIVISIVVIAAFYCISITTPSKKFDPSEHTKSGRQI